MSICKEYKNMHHIFCDAHFYNLIYSLFISDIYVSNNLYIILMVAKILNLVLNHKKIADFYKYLRKISYLCAAKQRFLIQQLLIYSQDAVIPRSRHQPTKHKKIHR